MRESRTYTLWKEHQITVYVCFKKPITADDLAADIEYHAALEKRARDNEEWRRRTDAKNARETLKLAPCMAKHFPRLIELAKYNVE